MTGRVPVAAGRAALFRIVEVNESAKELRLLGFRARRMGLNSIVVARRAGGVAAGFGVLCHEFLGFTRQLEGLVGALGRQTAEAVRGASEQLKHERLHRLLGLAGIQVSAHRTSASESGRRQLKELVDEADRASLTGSVLASGSRIEAAYGGEYRAALGEVAEDFVRENERILACLARLKKQLKSH